MNKQATVIIGIIVALIAVGGFIFMQQTKAPQQEAAPMQEVSSSEKPTPQATTASTSTESSQSGEVAADEKTIDIEAGSFYFKPNQIKVKKGTKVKVVLHAVSMMHNFTIDELNVKSPLVRNGESATIEFTANKAGSFTYYCAVGNHRQMGQEGKLIVEE